MFVVRHVLIVIAFQAMLCDLTKNTVQVSANEWLFETMSLILKLQTRYCTNVQLCTVNSTVYKDYSITRGRCCLPCSCEPECKYSNTCCPDIWIRDVIPDVSFESTHELMNTLRNDTFDIKQALENMTTIQTTIAKQAIQQNEECVSTWLKTDSGYQTNAIKDAFILVSKCPTDFRQRNNNEQQIKQLCESPMLKTGDIYLDLSHDTIIPFTSLQSGIAYRNVYCLQCNEGTQSGRAWSTWFVASSVTQLSFNLYEPWLIFRHQNRFTKSNMVFRPPTDPSSRGLRKCNFAHVTTCSKEWMASLNNSHMAKVYSKACGYFFSPVQNNNGSMWTTYNNIACHLCNQVERSPASCFNTIEADAMVEINTEHITKPMNSFSAPTPEPLNIWTNVESTCGVGHIYDQIENKCHMLYCPKNFFNDNGKCVPNILQTKGSYYSIKLMISSAEQTPLSKDENLAFEPNLNEHLKESLRKRFDSFRFKVWRNFIGEGEIKHLVLLYLGSGGRTFSETLDMTRDLLQQVSNYKVRLATRFVKLDVKFLKYDVFSLNTLTRYYSTSINEFVDTKRKKQKLFLINDYKSNSDNFTHMLEFPISRAHNCFRIKLNITEFDVHGKTLGMIRRTNIIVQGTDFDFANDEFLVYVCVNDYLNRTVKFWSAPKRSMSPAATDGSSTLDDGDSTLNTGVKIIGAFGGGLLCIILVIAYRKCVRRLADQQK